MEKLVAVSINNISKAYQYFVTWKKRVINDDVGGEPVVILHDRGAVSALDRPEIVVSREDGPTGVFHREVAGQLLTFSRNYLEVPQSYSAPNPAAVLLRPLHFQSQ